jgi:peptidylprolyl isomerase
MQKEESKDMIIFAVVFIVILVVAGIFAVKNGLGKKASNTNQTAQEQFTPVETTPSAPSTPTPQVQQAPAGKYSQAPAQSLEKGKQYQAILKTSLGNITLDLYADKTPITVNNFVFLAKEKFYDGTKFHRIISGFMIQGGDPEGTGAGGPGYSFNDEPFTGEYTAGTVAMANAGPDTNGSQFFIMHKDYALPKNYVIFGKAADTKSMAVVDSIAQTPVQAGPTGENSSPVSNILINSVEIIVK